MNIFKLDSDPIKAARYHCDKHVVKMILESAQLLCTAHRVLDDIDNDVLYRSTHVNHPCSKWCRESIANYVWLYQLFIALCDEYTHRYNKVHMCDRKLRDVLAVPPCNIPNKGRTPFRLATGDLDLKNTVKTYRAYYKTKTFEMKWTNRNIPRWYNYG